MQTRRWGRLKRSGAEFFLAGPVQVWTWIHQSPMRNNGRRQYEQAEGGSISQRFNPLSFPKEPMNLLYLIGQE